MYYDEIASGYDELYGEEQHKKLNFIFEKLSEDFPSFFKSVKTVLDVGCGTGISSDFFAEKGFSVTGIDPASEMIAQNDSHLCSFVVAQAEELPFDDRSFDLLFSLTSLQNFSDIDASLKEMLRVGKKKFVFSYLKTDKKDFIKKVVLRHFPSVRFYEDDKDIYCVLIL